RRQSTPAPLDHETCARVTFHRVSTGLSQAIADAAVYLAREAVDSARAQRSPRSMGGDRGAARAGRGAGCAGQHRLAARLGESRFPARGTPALVSRFRAAARGRTDLLAPSERSVLNRIPSRAGAAAPPPAPAFRNDA